MEKLNKVFRTAQLAAIDKYTIEHEPVSSLDLMERAAGIWTDRFLKKIAGQVREFTESPYVYRISGKRILKLQEWS